MSYSEKLGFKISVLVVSGFFVGISITNTIYFNRIRRDFDSNVDPNQATTMLIINLIIFFISIFIFMWALWKLIFTKKTRANIIKSTETFLTKDYSELGL